jgi:putative acyl-CoA dehydrogenase
MSHTHDVTNQSTPFTGVNLFLADRALREAIAHHAPALGGEALASLEAIGAWAGSEAAQQHARLANLHRPVLHTHDAQGRRVDEVEFHPSYHALLGTALAHGLHGSPWAEPPGGHLRRAAAFMLFTQAEASVLCPVSMSYAVAPALRANLALAGLLVPRLAARRYEPALAVLESKSTITMGMGMTEKQGGSDVRANTTRAERDGHDAWGERFAITGHKWFFSAPMCDAFLVLAQVAGAGLSCFFVPRVLPGGARNPLRLQRLKDKLGNHANASSEVEFEAASGWLVGEPGRGIPQILAMGMLTRLDCALGTAGLMRQALTLAVHHARQRHAFGRRLADAPLMRSVLADLALESEAATALALRLARAVDASEHGSADSARERTMRRVLTPIAKLWICKRGAAFSQEAMECLGGNGYVEAAGAGAMARVYREMPLNSIWEGAANVMALDLLRALRGAEVAAAIEAECAPARGFHPALDAGVARLLEAADTTTDESDGRRLAREAALVLQAVQLVQHAPAFVAAAFCTSRLAGGGADVFGALPPGLDLAAIVDRCLPSE